MSENMVEFMCESEDLEKACLLFSASKKRTFVVVQISPAVRVSIGEYFGFYRGEDAIGKIASALTVLGADAVVDTAIAFDAVTLMRAKALKQAKENGKELEIIDDVQMRFAGTSGIGFPQAAIFVSEAAYSEKKDQIDSMFNLMSDFSMQVHALDADAIAALIEACGGAEKFGVPSAQVVGKVWDRLNINVVDAREHMDELQKFAPLFDIQDVEAALLK